MGRHDNAWKNMCHQKATFSHKKKTRGSHRKNISERQEATFEYRKSLWSTTNTLLASKKNTFRSPQTDSKKLLRSVGGGLSALFRVVVTTAASAASSAAAAASAAAAVAAAVLKPPPSFLGPIGGPSSSFSTTFLPVTRASICRWSNHL